MHIIKLHITGKDLVSNEFFDLVNDYLDTLSRSIQVINNEYHFEPQKDKLTVLLFCPEKASYTKKNSTIYAKRRKKRLEEDFSCSLEFQYIGIDPEYGETTIAKNPNFLILKSREYSPIIDGTTLSPIPLYKFPPTNENESYDDLTFWDKNYDSIERLWNIGNVERWAQNQLQQHNSILNKQGIECCKTLERLINIPTYYFLFNYRAWGGKKDKKRKCPSCQGDWFIEGSTFNDFYAFKCDKCRLISELSSDR